MIPFYSQLLVLAAFGLSASALAGQDILLGGPVISELVAKNNTGLTDEDGVNSDWIEIFNATDAALDLTGWHLTDKVENLIQWTFPSITLAPQEYLVVFASGNDRRDPASELHTNFSLKGSGEYLALVAPDGSTKATEFTPAYPAQLDDVSYGFQGQEQRLGFFQNPTPGAENTGEIGLVLEEPIFSETSQILNGRPRLFITLPPSAPPGAVIRFTRDGSDPTPSSEILEDSLRLVSTDQVKAAVFDPDGVYETSEVVAHRFVKLDAEVSAFSSNLPIVVIDSFDVNVDIRGRTAPFTEAFSAFYNVDETTARATFSGNPDFVGNSGIRVRGASSSGFPKKQYRFETWDTVGNDTDVSLFGLPAESDWILNAPWSDKTMMRNHIAHAQGGKMGDYSVRTRHFELFFNQDGGTVTMDDYQGIYLLIERIKISEDRLDLAKLDSTDVTEPDISGGFILRKDRPDSSDTIMETVIEGVPIYFDEPDFPNGAQVNYMQNYLNDFERALHGPNSADPTTGFRAFIDEDSFIDQHLLTEGMRNADGYRLSTFFHKDRRGLLKAGPSWDFNLALGNASFLNGAATSGWHYISVLADNRDFVLPQTYWYSSMFEDEAFELSYWDRFFQLRKTQWDTPTLMAEIDATAAMLSAEATDREFERWPTLGVQTSANPPGFSSRLTYQSEVNYLKNFLTGRMLWIENQFDKPPVFSLPPGQVALNSTLSLSSTGNRQIRYTLDGSDPYDSPTATIYQGPITLTESTWVKARTRRSSGQWGALETARYVIDDTPVLVVSEINYRPSPATTTEAAAGFNRNDFEFLEITNPTNSSIDLSGAKFVRGLTFTFGDFIITPGQSVLLVENLAAFEQRYGDAANFVIAGEYQGNLDNDGETLTIEDQDRRTLLSFTYNDAAPWPVEADGLGRTLTLRTPTLFADEAASWRVSAVEGGSPGTLDSEIFTGDPDADDNNNGINNLVEYAVGSEPLQIVSTFPGSISISFTRKLTADSAEVILQTSGDLTTDSWTTFADEPASQILNSDGTETLTFSLPGEERTFARLLVRLR